MLSPLRKNIRHRTNSKQNTLIHKTESKSSNPYKLLSEVDHHVKTIISDLLLTIDPEDNNLNVESKIKELKQTNVFHPKNNHLKVDIPKITIQREDNIHLSPKQKSPEQKSNLRLNSPKSSLKSPSRIKFNDKVDTKYYISPRPMHRRFSKSFIINLIPLNNEAKEINEQYFNKTSTMKCQGKVIPHNKTEKTKKDHHLSVLPVFQNEDGPDGYISIHNKENLHLFQTIISDLKHTITATRIEDKEIDLDLSSEEELIDNKKESKIEKENKYRKLFLKHHPVYDSYSEDYQDDELINQTTTMNPYSTLKITFDIITTLSVLFIIIVSPIEIAYFRFFSKGYKIVLFIFNCLLDIWFINDCFIGFYTGYIDSNDNLISDKKAICLHYLNGWFVLDFITAIPFSLFISLFLFLNKNSEFYYSTYNFFTNSPFYLLHMMKLVKIIKVIKISIDNYLIHSIIQKLIQSPIGKQILIYVTLFIFVLFVHLFSCIFISIGYNFYPNWITTKNIPISNVIDIYIGSVYFICLTFFCIGYGDLIATNQSERVYSIFLLIVGIILYTWLISALSKLKKKEFSLDSEDISKYNTEMEIIRNIKSRHPNMSDLLFLRLSHIIQYKYERKQFNPHLIFEYLPSNLKKELIFKMYKPMIDNFIFFKHFNNEDFIMKVLMSFNSIVYYKRYLIINAGDFMEEMYFVNKGKLTIELPLPNPLSDQIQQTKMLQTIMTIKNPSVNNKEQSKEIIDEDDHYVKLLDICRNEHYGDIMMFLNQRSPLSVRVSSRIVELFSLKKTDVIEISMLFPNIWKEIITNSIYNMHQINILIKKTLTFFYYNNEYALEKMKKRFECFEIKQKDIMKTMLNSQIPIIVNKQINESESSITMNSNESLIKQNEPEKVNNEVSSFKFNSGGNKEEGSILNSLSSDYNSSSDLFNRTNSNLSLSIKECSHVLDKSLPSINEEIKNEDTLYDPETHSSKIKSICDLKRKPTNQIELLEQIIIAENEEDKTVRSFKDISLSKAFSFEIKSNKPMSYKIKRLMPKRKIISECNVLKQIGNFNWINKTPKRKRRSSQMLLTIKNNIEDNFQNLKNPDIFYSNAFQRIKQFTQTTEQRLDSILSLLKQCK